MKELCKMMALLCIILITSNCKNQVENFDYGKVENGIYINDYFKFNIKLPTDWIIQSKEQTEYISNLGKEVIAGDDENMKAVLKASEINVANLLAAFQHELGSAVDYNPSIMIIAENIKSSPGLKNGSDYLFHARKLMQQGQLKYDYLSNEFMKESYSNTDFYIMDANVNYMENEIKQKYYSTVLKGFCLNIIISYITEDQKEILLNTINSIKFDT